MKLSTRPAFTRIELLTVFGLVAVLSAIVLPSVVQSQEEARRNTCKNNLKQLALAIHNYHDVYNSFPPGWVAKNREADSGPWYGWQAAILPYMEQAPLFNNLNLNDYGKTDEKILKTVIPGYRCPSDPMVDLNPLRGKYATSSYSGNAGSQRLPGSVDPLKTQNGLFWWNSNCNFAQVRDGLSNTFLFGERCITSGSGIWLGLTKNRNENDAISDCSHHSRINRSITSFSSNHPEIVYFALCDGSVRPVSEKIDSSDDEKNPDLFQKLADRADGSPIGNF
ncbi:MAG TPA: DUF1559 domain-containing protein [Planctomycetaceae bacterium]|nr:DUF1559 domain-containing protein [Planctomycetaceae bacterium]